MERDGVATSARHPSLDAVLDHTSRVLTVCIPARSLLRERSRPNLDGVFRGCMRGKEMSIR
jgi:hypothetical protein